jgi:hypothetical protein
MLGDRRWRESARTAAAEAFAAADTRFHVASQQRHRGQDGDNRHRPAQSVPVH